MKDFRIAILGCGTIGGGTAKVLLENIEEFSKKAGRPLVLAGIVTPSPRRAARKYGIPRELFRGIGDELTKVETAKQVRRSSAPPTSISSSRP